MSKIVALTGPPAGGKSTVCTLFEDLGVPTIRTGDGIRAEAEHVYDDPEEDDIWQVAEDLRENHGPAGPTIACADMLASQIKVNEEPIVVVSDLREQAEVNFLQANFGDVLVIRVDTRNSQERSRRYVDREVGNLHEHEPIPRETERELRDELYERELRESPYPDHHLTLLNDDSVRTIELMCQIKGVCEFIDPDGNYDVGVEEYQ